jgi:hypothetical protein
MALIPLKRLPKGSLGKSKIVTVAVVVSKATKVPGFFYSTLAKR